MQTEKPTRRQQILHALAAMLEDQPGHRITTARLAERVGVSEAALYRHFPSKARMFEGLIDFIETTLFSRISMIINDPASGRDKSARVLGLLLTFAEKNPGISRILNSDALTGETDRLRTRVAQLYERLETQLRQILRETEFRGEFRLGLEVYLAANLMLAMVEGRISQFVRSDFTRPPTQGWDEQWLVIAAGIFVWIDHPTDDLSFPVDQSSP